MKKYCFKYYSLKAGNKEQNITMKNVFKICILKNIFLAFKTYFTIVKNQMQKNKE